MVEIFFPTLYNPHTEIHGNAKFDSPKQSYCINRVNVNKTNIQYYNEATTTATEKKIGIDIENGFIGTKTCSVCTFIANIANNNS